MNIFFLGARGDDNLNDTYLNIINLLKKDGHKVDAEWLSSTATDDAMDFEGTYKRNMQSIKNCDLIIAETTQISSGLGFQVATALNAKKPVLALYNITAANKPSATLKGSSNKNKYLTFKEYNSTKEIHPLVQEYVQDVKRNLDTKFILIISPEIDKYLEWSSEHRKMHKAQIVRQAVEEMTKKDKEYKEVFEA